MSSQSKAGFGFSSANETIRDLASAVKPKARSSEGSPLAALAVADSVAEEVGFMSRERPRAVVKRPPRPRAEPMQQLAMRLPISVLQAFATFADGEGVSYPKALALLLERERERRG